jgi:acyl-CoA synthetase (AMP-forming)/AMP-acid ligase II
LAEVSAPDADENEYGADLSIAGLVEATAELVSDRPAIVSEQGTRTYAELTDRARRLARFLADRGLGIRREREELRGHEVGQDLMAQYLVNGPEYLEGLLGAFRGRLAPFNVNYRYVADELRHLLLDSRPAAIQYHSGFAPLLARVLPDLDSVKVLLQVDDGSGHDLLPGAVDYEQALASVPPEVDTEMSPDDLYVLYTGGTTGMPKGVLWRQADAVVTVLGVRNRRDDREWTSLSERLKAVPRKPQRVMPLAPYMHGAAQWAALQALCEGNTVVVPREVRRFDADDGWDSAARHEVTTVTIVGDAFGRPLADAIEARPRELPSLRYLFSGGAALSAVQKKRLVAAIPNLEVFETIGSSEAGTQGRLAGVGDPRSGPPTFVRAASTVVLSEDMKTFLSAGHDGTGWLATSGRVPLGYLGDEEKTARTFPVVEGVRVSVPGDRARLLRGDLVQMLGRDSMTVNTGGEKVFVEEVESAVKAHPAVVDAVVCGRQSERWGAEVVALVQTRPGATPDAAEIIEVCARHVARYKLPKAVIFVDAVQRTASGKADYRWAVERATQQRSMG